MEQVGRYQIVEEVGRGAMGVVYKALDPAIGRTVAIKTIQLTELAEAGERTRLAERLRREARAAGTLSHPNIVTVYDVMEGEDFAYIVMEYVAGSSLAAMLREGQVLRHGELLPLVRQIAGALDYAHRKGIIHRDIKPANILISEATGGLEHNAKITDFGVAREIAQEATQSGNLSGTPSYMAPEQISGGQVDGRADQYSLAVVVYELLCGEKPFVADSLPGLLHAICSAEPKPVEQLDPALSETVDKVMRRALMKDPEQRFRSAGDFAGALSIALAESDAAGRVVDGSYGLDPMLEQAATKRSALAALNTGAGGEREQAQRRPPFRKLALIVFLCFAVAGALVFILRMNTGQPSAVQVADPDTVPVSPPPGDMNTPRNKESGSVSKTSPGRSNGSREAAAANVKRRVSTPEAVAGPKPAAGLSGGGVADVELLSEPAGARIAVDGRSDAVCTAPCTMSLPGGRHTLTAELSGYSVAKRIFNVPETGSVYIPLAQSTGLLFVTSIPNGANISVDGTPYGRTPATLHLAPGLHEILVSNGRDRRQDTVNIEPGSFQTRSIRW